MSATTNKVTPMVRSQSIQKMYRRWDAQTNWKLIARKAMDNVAQIQRADGFSH